MRPTHARDPALNAKERANARVLEPTLEDENQDPNYRHVGSDGMGELGKRCLNYNLELFDIDHDGCLLLLSVALLCFVFAKLFD